MPVVGTKAAASAQGFGEFTTVSGPATYIENVFSTYLYTGNSSTQTITNGIDESGKGALTWIKSRSDAYEPRLFDTARGATYFLRSDATNAQAQFTNSLTSFNSNGFSLDANASVNASGSTYASWTFREQPKFFDIVTWTGDGAGNRTISHNLGSTPGCIISKGLNQASNWFVYHQSIGISQVGTLQSQDAFSTSNATNAYGGVAPTSTQFTVGPSNNNNGWTYVAYLFAHNAGGFGLTGTDNVISCGSWTGSGAVIDVNLGYEPQWILYKQSSGVGGDWRILDTMRGWTSVNATNDFGYFQSLFANTSVAEGSSTGYPVVTSTGFQTDLIGTYIYIAIRRGPMKKPTAGTSVFSPIASSASQGTKQTTNFTVDLQIQKPRNETVAFQVTDRIRGVSTTSSSSGRNLVTSSTATESTSFNTTQFWDNTGFQIANFLSGANGIYWSFSRAPGFMDVVCYTGTGSARTVAHNLTAVPELMIVKRRNLTADWAVWSQSIAASSILSVNTTDAAYTSGSSFNSTAPTASVFTVGTAAATNASGSVYIAYLFASVSGVSKVGSYTGNGNTPAQGGQTINCGFTGSARFILIKCTSSAENWYVWDSARGIIAGNDPALELNTVEPEDNGYDAVDAVAGGFIINQNAAFNLNASGQSYIYLAIA